MRVFNTVEETKSWLKKQRSKGKSIGFVPTMGALHEGHLSLIKCSKSENDNTVCSIFINPIQFNNKEDLEKYPRTIDDDLKLLTRQSCDLVFYPSKEEMYPESLEDKAYDFGMMDKVMEGAYRPGHFNGVAIVVKRLFDIISPDKAYFGEKDYQQLCIIKKMTKMEKIDTDIIRCPTLRDVDGLAMSSRNIRLTPQQRSVAPVLFDVLNTVRKKKNEKSFADLKKWVEQEVNRQKDMRLEYIEIVDSETLMPIERIGDAGSIRACIAAYLGNVRLIDNIEL